MAADGRLRDHAAHATGIPGDDEIGWEIENNRGRRRAVALGPVEERPPVARCQAGGIDHGRLARAESLLKGSMDCREGGSRHRLIGLPATESGAERV